MSKNFISASVIASLILGWLVSGLFVTPPEGSEEAASPAVVADTARAAPSDRMSRVRVSRIDAEARRRSVTLRGRTEAKRIVEVTAEVAGQVVSRAVERGMQVSRGQLLCEIAIDDREVAVEEAHAGLDKAQI
jgi:membrane fusion protein, multidrug efflux system